MSDINSYIDHTLLKPDATEDQIKKTVSETKKYGFATTCVASCWVEEIFQRDRSNRLCTVIGFPHGNSSEYDKEIQMKHALWRGAKEVDIVVNIGHIKSAAWNLINKELECLTPIAHHHKGVVKYIVEVGYLTDDELYKIADLLMKYKVDYIKTCTGYGPRGVTVDDIKKIKSYVGSGILIKASGGIKTRAFAEDLIAAGANRLGTSSGVEIIQNKLATGAY